MNRTDLVTDSRPMGRVDPRLVEPVGYARPARIAPIGELERPAQPPWLATIAARVAARFSAAATDASAALARADVAAGRYIFST